MGDPEQWFDGKTALITGASGGIGRAIALGFARRGAKTALQYFNHRPDQLEAQIIAGGGDCVVVKADLMAGEFETTLLNAVQASLGNTDILINCAALQDVSDLEDLNADAFNAMMRMNVGAVFALSKLFAERLGENRTDASIVNISSLEAQNPAIGHGHYASSKAALETLTKAMALEYGSSGLRVNAIAPGLIGRDGIEDQWPEGVERWLNSCPLQRLGTPEDVADTVVFLASPMAAFITGTVLSVDGGTSAGPGW